MKNIDVSSVWRGRGGMIQKGGHISGMGSGPNQQRIQIMF